MNLSINMKHVDGKNSIQAGQDYIDDIDRDKFATTQLDAKCDGATPEQVAQEERHLTPTQHEDVRKLVAKYPKLFSNELRVYPHRKIHLEIDPAATPKHCQPYLLQEPTCRYWRTD
jgi:hypothetical protein